MEETMKQLMNMADGVGEMAKEAEILLERITEIRKRSEEIEVILNDCIALMNE